MTLVEFLAPLKNGSHKDRVLAILYYVAVVDGIPIMRVSDIRERMLESRIPRAKELNIADVLSRAGHLVDRETRDAGPYWRLTGSGTQYVERELGMIVDGTPTTTAASAPLEKLISTIGNDIIRGYLDEAITCLKVGALRATIVFIWSGAIRTLEEKALADHSQKDVNNALLKHDPKARQVKRVDDFAYIQDGKELLAFEGLGMLDKAERQSMEEALGLRNKCGHPAKFKPGEAKLAGYLEDVIGIVFA
jgi:hypothetical protein